MDQTTLTTTVSSTTGSTPRARRGDAAVLAQYIQDITHPIAPIAHAAVA